MRHIHIYSMLSVSLLFLAISHLSLFSPIYVTPVLALYLAFSLPKEDYVVWALPIMLFALMVGLTYYETPSMLFNLETRVTLSSEILIIAVAIIAGRYLQSRDIADILNFMILFTVFQWIYMSSLQWSFLHPEDTSFPIYQINQIQTLLWTVSYNLVYITALAGSTKITLEEQK